MAGVVPSETPPHLTTPARPLSKWLGQTESLDLRNLQSEWTRISSPMLCEELAWMIILPSSELLDSLVRQLLQPGMRDLFARFFKPTLDERRRLTAERLARNIISGEAVYGRLCGMVFAACAVRAVIGADDSGVHVWVDATLRSWHGIADLGIVGDSPVAGSSFCALDDAVSTWRALNSSYSLSQAGAVRSWIRALFSAAATIAPGLDGTDEDIYTVAAQCETWLLSYRADRATIARMHVEGVRGGEGCLYADPERIGLLPMSAEFLETIEAAYGVARGLQGEAALTAEVEHHDYRWWLEGYTELSDGDPALRGGSHGASAAAAFAQLLANGPVDLEFVVTGEVDAQGSILGVGYVKEKAAAALASATITRLCVSAANYTEACEGAKAVGRESASCVVAVKSVAELLPHASGLPEQIRRLCAREVDTIVAQASQRMQRRLTQCSDFLDMYVPVHVEISRYVLQNNARTRFKQAWLQVRDTITHGQIVADPGLGKTMLFWYEVADRCNKALNAMTEHGDSSESSSFGFYLSPKLFPPSSFPESASGLMSLLVQQILNRIEISEPLRPHLERYLSRRIEEGACVLYLDALDEAPNEVQANLPIALREFAAAYPQSRILLSMRLSALWESSQPLSEWDQVGLLPFRPEQIRQTVFAWFQNDPEYALRLWRHIEKSGGSLKSMETPLMLWIACNIAPSVREDGSSDFLWHRRSDLLERFVDSVIEKWARRSPVPSELQQAAFRTLLAELAFGLLRMRRQGDVWSRDFVRSQIESSLKFYPVLRGRDLFQDLLHSGVLTLLPTQGFGQALTFSHASVGDYLAGVCIAFRANTGKQAQMHEIINSVAGEPSWQDPIVFAAAHLDDPVALLDQLCDARYDDETRRRLALAAHCLAEISSGL